jgi:beta-glucosidase
MSWIDVDYTVEGSDVGYRYFARTGAAPLFAFGYGLTYTQFSTADLQIRPGDAPAVSVAVTNTGAVAATDIVQLYLTRAPHRRQQRLLGWARIALSPGQTQRATIAISPLLLCDWDQAAHDWRRDAGAYDIAIGTSAADLTLPATLHLAGQHIKP